MTDEHMQLLKLQAKWESEAPTTGSGSGVNYVDLSVSDMLQQAIKEGAVRTAHLRHGVPRCELRSAQL